MSALRQRLVELLEPVVGGTGHVLEDVAVQPAGRRSVVRVVVDAEDAAGAGGVSLDDVAEVSRVVSDALDELDEREPGLLGASYTLEVSSPGVSRPLTAARHWRRSVGRLVRAALHDGGTVTGRVLAADDTTVTLDVDGRRKELALGDVAQGTVQVEFARADDGGGS